ALLDRAAEVGLLTAHGGGSYSIHPALPWFFKRLFEQSYASDGLVALHSFAEALGELGNQYAKQYTNGDREVISSLRAEEQNLLHTFHLALDHGWLQASVRAMQGLRWLYDQTSRRVEWKRLVEEIVPQFVDPAAGGPLPGQEE